MTIDVLVMLIAGVENRDLVVEPQLRQALGDAEERGENPQMGGMRLRPAFELVQRTPVSDVVAQVEKVSVQIDVADKSVAVAADGLSVVSQEVHAALQSWQDLVEVQVAFGRVGVGPVLPGANQRDVVVTLYHHAATRSGVAADHPQFTRRLYPVGLG